MSVSRYLVPSAWAASHTIVRSCSRASLTSPSTSQALPKRWTPTIPLVSESILERTASTEMVKVLGSTSTKTGCAPIATSMLAVATKVKAGTMTLSPGSKSARYARVGDVHRVAQTLDPRGAGAHGHRVPRSDQVRHLFLEGGRDRPLPQVPGLQHPHDALDVFSSDVDACDADASPCLHARSP